ncbi:MAG: DoxX family protein [Chloroflexota bacterium]
MNRSTRYAIPVGRALLTLIFVFSGIGKIFSWEQTAHFMASKGMPWVPFFLLGAIALETIGGLCILVGYKARFGALTLIVFIIPATIIFHDFWNVEGMERQTQMIMFMKNLAILGGLLLILGYGAGPLSIDDALAGGKNRYRSDV